MQDNNRKEEQKRIDSIQIIDKYDFIKIASYIMNEINDKLRHLEKKISYKSAKKLGKNTH